MMFYTGFLKSEDNFIVTKILTKENTMNKKDFLAELTLIRQDYKKTEEELFLNFSEENNPYKIGDIVRDHYHIIKIRKIKHRFPDARGIFNSESDFPTTIFTGTELTKDLSPKKIQKNIYMCLCNIKRKLN